MIGVNNSPLNMFTGQSNNGPSMYQIGYAGGPGGGINAALNSTIDRYHANLDAQNQQAMKLAQIHAEGNIGLGRERSLIDYRNSAELNKAKQINDMNSGMSNGGLRVVNIDGRKVFMQDHADNAGVIGSTAVQPTPYPTMDQIIGQKMQNQMPGIGVGMNTIQQGANGAVADATGAQTALPAGVTEEDIQHTLQLHPEYTRDMLLKKLGQ